MDTGVECEGYWIFSRYPYYSLSGLKSIANSQTLSTRHSNLHEDPVKCNLFLTIDMIIVDDSERSRSDSIGLRSFSLVYRRLYGAI